MNHGFEKGFELRCRSLQSQNGLGISYTLSASGRIEASVFYIDGSVTHITAVHGAA